MLEGPTILLLREGTEQSKGKDARRDNVQAAIAVAESIRSTLGPRGMDKMMVDGSGGVVITNDGATILRTMEIQHPAAKMLVEVAKAQDQECGDGTKSSVILTGELLKKADELLDEKVHATRIVDGYRQAAAVAVAALREIARPVGREDTELLRRIARTSMISKGVAGERQLLAELAVRAVVAVLDEQDGGLRFDRKQVQLVKRPGERIADSELVEGHVLTQGPLRPDMPRTVPQARLALVEAALEGKKTEWSSEIRITEPSQIQSFLDEEGRMLQTMVDAVRAAGATVLFVEKGVGDVAAEALAKAGIYAVRNVPRSDLELLARASGGRLVARAADLTSAELGSAALVEERILGTDHLTFVTGCPHARSVTLLLRAGTEHVVDEVERSVVDALASVGLALQDGRVNTGAGASAVELALRVRSYASTVGGREQLAVRAFADALEVIPITLAENAGMDPIDALIELRRRHAQGEADVGVDVLAGRVADMREVAVEPVRLGVQVIQGATETSALLLRIDTVIAARRRPSGASAPSAPRGLAAT